MSLTLHIAFIPNKEHDRNCNNAVIIAHTNIWHFSHKSLNYHQISVNMHILQKEKWVEIFTISAWKNEEVACLAKNLKMSQWQNWESKCKRHFSSLIVLRKFHNKTPLVLVTKGSCGIHLLFVSCNPLPSLQLVTICQGAHVGQMGKA